MLSGEIVSKKLWFLVWLNLLCIALCASAWIASYQVQFSLVIPYENTVLDCTAYRGQFSFGHVRYLDNSKDEGGIHAERTERGEARQFDLAWSDRGYYGFGWMSDINKLHVHNGFPSDNQLAWDLLPPTPPAPPIYVSVSHVLMFPAWSLTALTVLPLFLLIPRTRRFFRRRRDLHAGVCITGSYDLRAHRIGDKCPECGTPVISANSRHEVDNEREKSKLT